MNGTNAAKGSRILMLCILLLLGAVLMTAIALGVALLQYDAKTHQTGALHPIAIQGVYSEEGGPWTPLTSDTTFQNLDLRDITLRGHFTRPIPQGEQLYLNLDHMWVSLRVNGQEIYQLKPVEGDGNPTRAMGKQYVAIVSPGITTEDDIELNFGNLYRNAYMIQFDELLHHMHIGNERMMLFEALRKDGWTLGIGALFSFLTLLLVFTSACCGLLRVNGALRFLWLGLTTFFASLWFFTLSPALTLIFPRPIFLNVLYAFSTQCMVLSFILVVLRSLSAWRRKLLVSMEVLLLLVLLVSLVNQLLRVHDLYSAINYASIFALAAALCATYCLWYEAYRLQREEAIALLKALFLLIVCGALELINGYVQFSEAAILLGVGLISFTSLEGLYLIRRIKRGIDSEKRALLLENELTQKQIALMTSQIQPHFLCNALLGIKQLCDDEPKKASEALEHFSYYLRGNLDSLTHTALIPFEKECEHLRDYLYLEQMRFGDKLHIVWDLSCHDFMLPPLTVQPIAENAVRYGITRKQGGGTLTIASERNADTIVLTVHDDGAGFELEGQMQDGRSHTGIENVRSRLRTQCGGSLHIESIPGSGTSVTIRIPLQEEEP